MGGAVLSRDPHTQVITALATMGLTDLFADWAMSLLAVPLRAGRQHLIVSGVLLFCFVASILRFRTRTH